MVAYMVAAKVLWMVIRKSKIEVNEGILRNLYVMGESNRDD